MAKSVKALRVVAKREGFRRAGRVFGAMPTFIPLDTLRPDAHDAIVNDPNLVALEVDAEMTDTGEIIASAVTADKAAELDALHRHLEAHAEQLDRRTVELAQLDEQLKQRTAQADERDRVLQAREEAVTIREAAQLEAEEKAKEPAPAKRTAQAGK